MAAPCSHYEVLGVGQEATPELVKAAYQKLVLALHPDKVGDATHDSFQLLQQAWQTLRDPQSRALYDHELSQAELRATVVLHDELDLQDMDHSQQPAAGGAAAAACDSNKGSCGATITYSYPCRCGDSYNLSPADMQLAAASSGQQIILPCRSCSNHVLVRLPP